MWFFCGIEPLAFISVDTDMALFGLTFMSHLFWLIPGGLCFLQQAEDMVTDPGETVFPPDMMITTPTPEMMDGGDGDTPGNSEPSATDGGYPTQVIYFASFKCFK